MKARAGNRGSEGPAMRFFHCEIVIGEGADGWGHFAYKPESVTCSRRSPGP